MTRSFTMVYMAARFDAPDALLLYWGTEWVYEDDTRSFKIAAVPQAYALRLVERLREGGALFAPDAYRFIYFIYPTLQSAISNAETDTEENDSDRDTECTRAHLPLLRAD